MPAVSSLFAREKRRCPRKGKASAYENVSQKTQRHQGRFGRQIQKLSPRSSRRITKAHSFLKTKLTSNAFGRRSSLFIAFVFWWFDVSSCPNAFMYLRELRGESFWN